MRAYANAGLMAGFLMLTAGSCNALAQSQVATTTPIQHLVVIFDENISFDHYFATYPHALNPAGEPVFTPAANTPTVNGLTPSLLTNNPNPAQPFRLDRSQYLTCDNDNAYTDEQTAYHGGLIDKVAQTLSASGAGCTPNLSMGYYDGNTVTAMWNYAQHFSMSDNFFATTFGTTVMGHLNLISGQTHQTNLMTAAGKVTNGSVTANVQAGYDDCGATPTVVQMSGKNVGQLLSARGVTWGWFYGDFAPTAITNGVATCSSLYNNHYDPFQYYQATANPHHLPPTSTAMIGQSDQANHQYALSDLWNAVAAGNLPEVTFIKASSVSTGHPSTSNPLAEQTFLVQTINALQQSPQWPTMAILITYDDSDGWYDHVMPPIVNPSNDSTDTLAGAGVCGTSVSGSYQDRCGYGPRLPFLVISPFAKQNNVDHTVNDQTSILRFIEDNWGLPRIGDQSFDALAGPILSHFDFTNPHYGTVLLNSATGEVTSKKSGK